MRLGVTIGRLADGTFAALSLPDRAVQEQRASVREIILAGGRVELGGKRAQLAEILYFDEPARRKRFNAPAESAPAPARRGAKG